MSPRDLAHFILGMGVASFGVLVFWVGLTVVMGAYCQP